MSFTSVQWESIDSYFHSRSESTSFSQTVPLLALDEAEASPLPSELPSLSQTGRSRSSTKKGKKVKAKVSKQASGSEKVVSTMLETRSSRVAMNPADSLAVDLPGAGSELVHGPRQRDSEPTSSAAERTQCALGLSIDKTSRTEALLSPEDVELRLNSLRNLQGSTLQACSEHLSDVQHGTGLSRVAQNPVSSASGARPKSVRSLTTPGLPPDKTSG